MKKTALFVMVAFVLSCKKDDPALFVIPVPNLTFQVDATFQPPFTYYIPINNVTTNAFNVLAAKGVDTSQIKSIRPGKAFFSVLFAESDLNFLDAVSVRVCPVGVNTENCGREVFYRDPVPFKPGFDLDLVPSNVNDIREVVLKDKVNVQVKFERLRGFPERTFTIRLDMDFEVR